MVIAKNKRLRVVVAENIKELRGARGLSQEALADRAELHRTYISSVERCERNITLDTVERLAIALDVPAVRLLQERRS